MPRRKVTSRKTRSTTASKRVSRRTSRITRPEIMEPVVAADYDKPLSRTMVSRKWSWVFLILLLLVALFWFNRSLVLAAWVNSRPVWRWDLEKRLISRYGSQTLDEMVNEQILQREADRRHLTVSQLDVNNKIVEIEKSLEGKVSLKDALAQQGMTMDDLRDQVRLQLLVEKLTVNLTVSESEIDDYLSKNRVNMISTDEGQLREEAKLAILSQKRNQEFRNLFDSLKKNAKVYKFI